MPRKLKYPWETITPGESFITHSDPSCVISSFHGFRWRHRKSSPIRNCRLAIQREWDEPDFTIRVWVLTRPQYAEKVDCLYAALDRMSWPPVPRATSYRKYAIYEYGLPPSPHEHHHLVGVPERIGTSGSKRWEPIV